MTHSRSFTSATPNGSDGAVNLQVGTVPTIGWRTAWFAIFLLGVTLRLLRISWQPLWWDEGYSVYFATEPLATMLSLTARDIHPPLYYTLLHVWFQFFGSSSPEVARLLSVLVGIATLPVMTWASLTLWPRRRAAALVATLLLAASPIHIYYSQEVRMYGLALLLTLLASTFLWRMQQRLERGDSPLPMFTGYVIAASLALLTLYYTGFLLLAHHLWLLVANRKQRTRLLWILASALLIILIQLPWWLYALPKLIAYVADKVLADQDTPLGLLTYLWRHWLAFFSGHLPAAQPWLESVRIGAAALTAVALLTGIRLANWKAEKSGIVWLFGLCLIPLFVGFAVNLAYPFFPDGGERLLFQILPYVQLLVAVMLGKLFVTRSRLSVTLLLLPLLAATSGIVVYFFTLRYVDHDYRPIIADVMQQSRPHDTVLVLFPWQIGYWRAYSPITENGQLLPPQPQSLDQSILRWDESFAAKLDASLTQGTVWFPMPLSFGSTLPIEIESYLKGKARNLENKWYSPATRLTAWTQPNEAPSLRAINADFAGETMLTGGGIAPLQVASENAPIAIDLCWQPPTQRDDLRSTLRLIDVDGFIWASRDLTPLLAYATNDNNPCLESIALNIPIGIPPGIYQLVLGVGPKDSDQLFAINGILSSYVTLGNVNITAPKQLPSPDRLPIDYRLSSPVTDEGLALLGASGQVDGAELLAGDEVAISLFVQNKASQPPLRHLSISFNDRSGASRFTWQGWSLPNYPTDRWQQDTLTQVPVRFYLPADFAAGDYTLTAAFVEPASGKQSDAASLGQVTVTRRQAVFTAPAISHAVTPSPTAGTHATLIGYDIKRDGPTLELALTWHVLQPLLPPHHLFVHLLDASGTRVAQADGEPLTDSGRAPTGSWLPGEYVTVRQNLKIPDNVTGPFTIQTGLYLPSNGARLPITANGEVTGDHIAISLPDIP